MDHQSEEELPVVSLDQLRAPNWLDKLPEGRRRLLARRIEGTAPEEWLIDANHGSTIDSQLSAGRERFLSLPEPFYMVRLGDAELALMASGYRPFLLKDVDTCLRFCGLSRRALHLRSELLISLQRAHLVGLHQNWESVRRLTSVVLKLCGFRLPLPTGVEVHLPYRLLADGTLFSFLADRRVLLIGHLAPLLSARLRERCFLESNRFLGPIDRMIDAGSVGTKDRNEGAWNDLDEIMQQARRHDYEIALVSCGAPAKLLCKRLFEEGKTALDVGFVFDALLGDGERRLRPVLKDIPWPVQC